MLDMIIGVFSSSGIGAIVGLVGSWLTKKEERRNMEISLSHEKEMYHLKSTLQRHESEIQLKLAEQGLEIQREKNDTEVELKELSAFETSQRLNQPLTNRFAELIRGLMRPVITLYLLTIATYIALHISAYLGDIAMFLQKEDMVSMYRDMLDKVMFLTTTAVTWWFGSRPGNAHFKKV
ncbi:hypothetical protein [Marinomonas balearica]|uniref:Uncharacterized protein n=1 Tax=Marinomonas balearica TaxID=491947 RepID=A0A4R6M5W0_9GAMM|nr:hypothetical protein [Marinomonas balearica]TDO96703.1 hypothetical protein DFP79_2466 [Marinomonas balearica]